MNTTEVAVTGAGAVSPAGTGADALWKALADGTSLAVTDPNLAGMAVDFSCRVPEFDADALLGRRLSWRLDRFTHLALVAAREAVTDAALDPTDWDAARVAVVLGVGSNSLQHYDATFDHIRQGRLQKISPLMIPRSAPNVVAGEIAMDLRATGPNFTTSSACASGTTAIGVARDLLRSGACDIAITGGTESGRTPAAAAGFWRMRARSERVGDPRSASRPFDAARDGFVLSEGAGVLVLERATDARARQARIRGYLIGYGASTDAHHFTAPHPEGDGAVQAMRTALRDAALEPGDIGQVNAHGTSTPHNDLAENVALRRVFGSPPPVTANKGVLGHTLGAAGALEAIATLLSLEHQLIPPTANLERLDPAIDLDVVAGVPRPVRMAAAVSNSFGFGGQNAVLVLRAA
ncbi:beta-ketoacyl-[acyl-carrier-protein] synthase family protein [Streptomyces sp. NPDC048473]|uniref:beta-ketoacyl-[acyl-carrier-protein] synthase family protein n=1 Tax=unclassified Streptomyces TaxID=2593676 RepID=UPI003711D504